MLLKSILTEDRTLAKIPGGSKKRVLENFAKIFSEEIGLDDPGELFQHFINRERLGSTGIGQGIAIPHCRFDTRGKTLCACITLEDSVDFDAIDNAPVDIIFAMLVPTDAESEHLETLATLAESLQKSPYVSGIRESKSSKELYKAATV